MERTLYYEFDDGSYAVRTVTVPDEATVIPPPDGGREITKEEYDAGMAQLAEEKAEAAAAREAAEQEQCRQDYEALIAAGIPEETARRMSGYTGPAGDES